MTLSELFHFCANIQGEEQPLKRVDSPPVSTENFVIAKREANVARGELISLPSLSNPSSNPSSPEHKPESLSQANQAKGM